DMYYAAFRIPDLIYGVLIMGAISSAFIPVFSRYLTQDKKEAWRMVSGFLNLAIFTLIILGLVLVIISPWLIPLIAPGFSLEKKEITIALTRIMFLSPILFGISSIFSGILHSFRRFLVASLAPIMYNLGIIIGVVFLTKFWGIFGLAWGVVLGAFLHMLIQIPSVVYSGFRYQWIWDIYHRGVRKIVRLMIPRTIGLAAFHVNLIVITAIASTLASGSVAVFNLANNLQYVPIGIFGLAFATAAFPTLVHAFSQKKKEEFLASFNSTFRQILFLVIPAGVLIYLLRAQIVRVVLGTGEFGWLDTRLTAACLGLFSLSIFAQSLIPLVARTFYARHNTRTPVLISIISIIFNIGASFFFVFFLTRFPYFINLASQILKLEGISEIGVVGLPLAFSLAGILNLILLLITLYWKVGDYGMLKIFSSFFKIIISSLLMGGGIYLSLHLIAPLVNMRTFVGVATQGIGAGLIGLAIYLLISLFLRSPELILFYNGLRRRLPWKKVAPTRIPEEK
ncbi:MAG TPA: murein biosynthesis integral membrane protein MurJ, partial [Candidatus Portnoybacteria bacterium]|nr:murein biosynthesis integral membrane protein MurJ [Candidatus Portnoybacteria bacterium]